MTILSIIGVVAGAVTTLTGAFMWFVKRGVKTPAQVDQSIDQQSKTNQGNFEDTGKPQ